MHLFHWFVIPFLAGLIFLSVKLLTTYVHWIAILPKDQLKKIKNNIFTFRTLLAFREVLMECLLHRKIFKTNPILGYMHTSLAFGWFLLILIGNWECRIFYHEHISPPYIPIFFRFFNPHPIGFQYESFFSFLMDCILLIVLSGVLLAWIKRLKSRYFGLKKTTQLKLGDKLALTALWMIFPLRLFAEGLSSACFGGGNFLTNHVGIFLCTLLPVHLLIIPAWFMYSLSLGLFFIGLPYSRYMHIPTEVILIFLRNLGVSEKSIYTSFTKVQINACSRCGICIDPCQQSSIWERKDKIQSVYFLHHLRYNIPQIKNTSQCLMCGRCDISCPVGIDLRRIRQTDREMYFTRLYPQQYKIQLPYSKITDVVYFSGCMGRLLPGITHSMISIFKMSHIQYWHMDQNSTLCCGRPLLLSGKEKQGQEHLTQIKDLIKSSHAKTLVTSCPICFKMFNNNMGCEVLHHSEFLLRLVQEKRVHLNQLNQSAMYHDPCELGRGENVYDEPRELLASIIQLKHSENEKERAFCCGGSIAAIGLDNHKRKLITESALKGMALQDSDYLITACPLCKKTFSMSSNVKVLDIAEIMLMSIKNGLPNKKEMTSEKCSLTGVI